MTPTLVLIPVPPEEAKKRLAQSTSIANKARQEAKGLRRYGPKDKRNAKRVADAEGLRDLHDAIAKGCKEALDELMIQPTEWPEHPLDVVVTESVGYTQHTESVLCTRCGNPTRWVDDDGVCGSATCVPVTESANA